MGVVALKDEGVLAVWGLKQGEYETARAARMRELDDARAAGRVVPDFEEYGPVKGNPVPVWKQVSGLGTEDEWRLKPHERRGALLRLARTVERMIRFEWKQALAPKDGTASGEVDPFADGDDEKNATACRYAMRTAVWDPVAEICHYLEIAQTKLSDLLRQGTGLRARELSDCVRAEEVRAYLKEKMRRAAHGWLKNSLRGERSRELAKISPEDGAAVVLCEHRMSADFLDRDGLAKKFGMGSRARLYRAVRLSEGVELADLERDVALEVFLELLPEIWIACELSREEVEEASKGVERALGEMRQLRQTG